MDESTTTRRYGVTGYGTEHALRCVNCNGECLHPTAVYVVARHDSGNVAKIVAIDVADRGPAERMIPDQTILDLIPESRGSAIGRVYWCEFCPNLSMFTEHFHKGTTYTDAFTWLAEQ